MFSEQRPEMVKPRVLIASLAAIIAFFAVACLLILYTSAPVNSTPPAAAPSYQAADDHAPSDAAEAERSAAAPQRAELSRRQPATPQQAEPTPGELAAQRQAEPTPREPQTPQQDPEDPTADRLSASEQIVFKSRAALESVDPRELLRQGVL